MSSLQLDYNFYKDKEYDIGNNVKLIQMLLIQIWYLVSTH